jgi:hypothetical protein
VSLSAVRGRDYCFSARARDALGNTSGWTRARCTALPLDDRSLTRSCGWRVGTSSRDYAGTWARASNRGAQLTISGAQVRRIALVVLECPFCGSIAIYIGGSYWKTVNTHATTATYKLILLEGVTNLRSVTIVLKITSNGKPVTIDGLGISRT